MSEPFPREFQFLVLQDQNLRQYNFNGVFIYCQNIGELIIKSRENPSFDKVLVCTDTQFPELIPLLSENVNINAVYIRTDLMDIWWPTELKNENVQFIRIGYDEKELMRHLYLKAMMCYFLQGKEYKRNENHGLSNRCFLDAKNALKEVDLLN